MSAAASVGRPRSGRGTSLWPREHGAYVQLLFPLCTAFALGAVSASSVLFALSLVAGFLANEPVLILAGHRGVRARTLLESRAKRQAGLLLAVAAVAGASGFYLANPAARASVVPLGVAALPVAWLAVTKREKTWYGEALVSVVFAYGLVPVALAAGFEAGVGLAAAGVWALCFLVQLATVHALLRRAKRSDIKLSVGVMLVSLTLIVLVGVALREGFWLGLGILPTAFASVMILALKVGPRRLRRVGWSLVAADLVTLLLLVGVLR